MKICPKCKSTFENDVQGCPYCNVLLFAATPEQEYEARRCMYTENPTNNAQPPKIVPLQVIGGAILFVLSIIVLIAMKNSHISLGVYYFCIFSQFLGLAISIGVLYPVISRLLKTQDENSNASPSPIPENVLGNIKTVFLAVFLVLEIIALIIIN